MNLFSQKMDCWDYSTQNLEKIIRVFSISDSMPILFEYTLEFKTHDFETENLITSTSHITTVKFKDWMEISTGDKRYYSNSLESVEIDKKKKVIVLTSVPSVTPKQNLNKKVKHFYESISAVDEYSCSTLNDLIVLRAKYDSLNSLKMNSDGIQFILQKVNNNWDLREILFFYKKGEIYNYSLIFHQLKTLDNKKFELEMPSELIYNYTENGESIKPEYQNFLIKDLRSETLQNNQITN